MRLTIETMGETLIDRELLRYAERAEDLGPFWRWWFGQMRSYEARGFESEGRTFGSTWRRLAKSTIAYKNRVWPGRKKLERTKRLRKSLTSLNSADSIRTTAAGEAIFGSQVPYGIILHKGIDGRMPARPIIKLTRRAKDSTVKGLQMYMATGTTPPSTTGFVRGL